MLSGVWLSDALTHPGECRAIKKWFVKSIAHGGLNRMVTTFPRLGRSPPRELQRRSNLRRHFPVSLAGGGGDLNPGVCDQMHLFPGFSWGARDTAGSQSLQRQRWDSKAEFPGLWCPEKYPHRPVLGFGLRAFSCLQGPKAASPAEVVF